MADPSGTSAIEAFVDQARWFIRTSSAEVVPGEAEAAEAIRLLGDRAEAALVALEPSGPADVRAALERTAALAPLVAIAGDQTEGAATEALGEACALVMRWWRTQVPAE